MNWFYTTVWISSNVFVNIQNFITSDLGQNGYHDNHPHPQFITAIVMMNRNGVWRVQSCEFMPSIKKTNYNLQPHIKILQNYVFFVNCMHWNHINLKVFGHRKFFQQQKPEFYIRLCGKDVSQILPLIIQGFYHNPCSWTHHIIIAFLIFTFKLITS